MSEEENINQPTNDGQSSTENNSADGETSIMNEEQQTENLPIDTSFLKLQTKEMEVHHHHPRALASPPTSSRMIRPLNKG